MHVRTQNGDDAAGAFYHDASRAFFTEDADISRRIGEGCQAGGHRRSSHEVAAAKRALAKQLNARWTIRQPAPS
jgi:hypothetical protein